MVTWNNWQISLANEQILRFGKATSAHWKNWPQAELIYKPLLKRLVLQAAGGWLILLVANLTRDRFCFCPVLTLARFSKHNLSMKLEGKDITTTLKATIFTVFENPALFFPATYQGRKARDS